MAITTTAEYKSSWAGVGGTADDTFIGVAVDAAQEAAEQFIGYTLDGAERTEYYSGEDTNIIVLKGRPVVSITSVTPILPDGTSGTAWASTDYTFDADTGEMRLTPDSSGRFQRDDFGAIDFEPTSEFGQSPTFGAQWRNVKVVYKAGWGSSPYTAAPTNLKRALWQIIDAMIRSQALATGAAEGQPIVIESIVARVMAPWKRYIP